MPPTPKDVDAALGRVSAHVKHTPLLESEEINKICKCRVLLKAECLQEPGSFKIRGAVNRILLLNDTEREKGVVAFSSGNFGKGLACAAKRLQVPCSVVVPADAPERKKNGIKNFGATVIESPILEGENREVTAARVADNTSREQGMTLLHPFEDHDVIAGQGTAGLEIISDLKAKGVTPTAIVIPAGGGGLSAGCNLAFSQHLPDVTTFIVEPEHYNDHQKSLLSGERERVPPGAPYTVCDALQAVSPGANTFPINKARVKAGLAVTDEEVTAAQNLAETHLGIRLEPSGACSLAAVLARAQPLSLTTTDVVVVIGSGGDPLHEPKPDVVFA
eukprot:TRINITY_DN9837_c0_g1_i2.p1 TRINITY_DN9837_c0_g1~~TRINITY_DN9837_c0_g1_i2.p1  ORF type:complete len:333 (+),score=73.93 TRINITY_DN9837_c0_g1_i2:59-1057(+)